MNGSFNTENDEQPVARRMKKSESGLYCPICNRIGHYGEACATKIQIFEWPYHVDGEVNLVGDFSQWQRKHPMNPPDKDHPFWWLQLSLAPSKYQFKFFVDGEWKHDPKAPSEIDSYGTYNNVVDVKPALFQESDEEEENPNDYAVLIHKKEEEKEKDKGLQKMIKITYPFNANWVSLKGSWDDWAQEIPLKKFKNNITGHYEFYVKIRVSKGIYEYKFLVDGQWIIDPSKLTVKKQDGYENNILEVRSRTKLKTVFFGPDKKYLWEPMGLIDAPADFKYMFQGHSMSIIGEEVYIFGGMVNQKFSNEMYKINLATSKVTIVEQLGQIPEARAYHGMTVFYNKIIIFGGFNEKTVLSDYHVFSTATKRWSESSEPWGEVPEMRERFSLVPYHEQHLILFAGYYCTPDLEYEVHYNDVYALNMSNLEWHKIDCIGDIPDPRLGHSASIINNDMFIFGGKNYNDFHSLRINKSESKMQWKNIDAKGEPPAPRHGHSTVVSDANIIIYGGRGNLGKLYEDVIVFDTVTETWIHPIVEGSNSPKGRFYHACQMISNLSVMLVFGGCKKEFNMSTFYKLIPVSKEEDDEENELPIKNRKSLIKFALQ